MTVLKITVDDEQVGLLRKLLQGVPFVKKIEEDHLSHNNSVNVQASSNERIKKLLDNAKGKNLFAEIKNPSEWQRDLRKEWDRDF